MSRAIVAAAVIFATAALILHRTVFSGAFLEPALLLTMGSFFLVAARTVGHVERRRAELPEAKPVLVQEEQRASA